MGRASQQSGAQAAGTDLPEGFLHRPEFLNAPEEAELLRGIGGLEFSEVRMHGVIARRRVAHFGYRYGFESAAVSPGPALPEFLLGLRDRCAALAGVEGAELAEALVTEYSAGAGIGWHRDAPAFGLVVAVSLLGRCRLRLRRGKPGAWETREVLLEPRSAYLLSGKARTVWQHHIPPTREPRYSITFRTVRRPFLAAAGPQVAGVQ